MHQSIISNFITYLKSLLIAAKKDSKQSDLNGFNYIHIHDFIQTSTDDSIAQASKLKGSTKELVQYIDTWITNAYKGGEICCKECSSTLIIDEVVPFCGNCRSYEIGFKFPNGKFETPADKHTLALQEQFIGKEDKKEAVHIDYMKLSDIIDLYSEYIGLDHYYVKMSAFRHRLETVEQKESFDKVKDLFQRVDHTRSREYFISKGDLDSLNETISEFKKRIEEKRDIFLSFNRNVDDHTDFNNAWDKLSLPNAIEGCVNDTSLETEWDKVVIRTKESC